MYRKKPDFRRKNVSQKVEPTVSQVKELMASLKKDRKLMESRRRILHECAAKTCRKRRKKRKQHLELVPTLLNESKPVSKEIVVERAVNGDLPVKSIMNAVFRSKNTK
ncbi:hypothetical protein ACTXT7_000906 [Hymenolepis weldensis]